MGQWVSDERLLTEGELRRIVAESTDENARRAARRELNARSDSAPMPEPLLPPVNVDQDELHRLMLVRVRALIFALGRPLTVAECGQIVRDAYRDLRPKGR